MKKKEKENLVQKNVSELKQGLDEAEKALIEAKFKLSKGQLQNVRLPRKLRNKIAFIKTIISQKEKKNV